MGAMFRSVFVVYGIISFIRKDCAMKEKVNSEAVRNLSALKTLAVAAAMSVTPLVQGATYDIAAGDVTDLTNKLATCRTSSTTLRLAAGDYDLTGI